MPVQLTGCVGEHKEEEKIGLAWFKAADKACGTYASAHHAFVSWLTLTVWFQLVICALLLLTGLVSSTFSDVFFDLVFSAIWCLIWGYTGYWSFAYGNKCWMVVFTVFTGISALNAVRGITHYLGLLDTSIMYLIVAICGIALAVSLVHTAVFAVFSLMKTDLAPSHLSFHWSMNTEAKPATEAKSAPAPAPEPQGDVEAPAPATMAP
eukprot:COSAG02_NODE_57_length_43668_cov_118.217196_36_plen_208_part_00